MKARYRWNKKLGRLCGLEKAAHDECAKSNEKGRQQGTSEPHERTLLMARLTISTSAASVARDLAAV